MTSFLPLLPFLLAMVVLMGCSAFFSASEAALFYLRPRDRRAMAGGTVGEQAAAELMSDPDRLLSAVLFWNLVINVGFFTLSSVVSIRMELDANLGQSYAIGFACLSLLAIIVSGELIPKSFAVLKPRALARLVSLPLLIAVRVVDPLMPVLNWIKVISRRIMFPGFRPEPYMDVTDLERAIELSGNDAELIRQEQAVLQNIVQLSEIRIDEWMRPRTQFQSFQPPVSRSDFQGNIPPSGYVLITSEDSREIQKALRLDNQYQLPDDEIERLGEPVLYLPWCATVADALEKMSQREREVTVVVNEYGDTIGIMTIEDILETVFTYAPSRSKRLLDMNPIRELEPGKWVVSGMMSLRHLRRKLDIEMPESHSVTIGGVIQEEIQRLAQTGDECEWGPFQIHVVEAPQRGNMLVELTLKSAIDESSDEQNGSREDDSQ